MALRVNGEKDAEGGRERCERDRRVVFGTDGASNIDRSVYRHLCPVDRSVTGLVRALISRERGSLWCIVEAKDGEQVVFEWVRDERAHRRFVVDVGGGVRVEHYSLIHPKVNVRGSVRRPYLAPPSFTRPGLRVNGQPTNIQRRIPAEPGMP
ncbi:hypothetical protein FB451DRAFT_1194900 [Mycena latifolia]|nr:hypothetical protein FB451DRAFT_1194900 [Mycena latifolia]